MIRQLKQKYDVNRWYENDEALDIFKIRSMKEDKQKRKISIQSECDGIVVFTYDGKYYYQYRRGDPVSSSHHQLIPCNIELFIAKCVNHIFQFYWK